MQLCQIKEPEMENATIPFPSKQPAAPTCEGTIEGLAERIQAAHSAFEAAHRMCLERARECGELLVQAKALHKHGGWLAWLKANVPFTPRAAQHYMKIALNWDKIAAKCETVSYLTLGMAIESLKERPPVDPPEVVRQSNEDRGDDAFQAFWRKLVKDDPKWRRRYERLQGLRQRAKELAEQIKQLQVEERQASNKVEKPEKKMLTELSAEFDRQVHDATDDGNSSASTTEAEVPVPCTA
jgi:hypothetical protein